MPAVLAILVVLFATACSGSPTGRISHVDERALSSSYRYEIRPSKDLGALAATVCFDGPSPLELRAGKDEAASRLAIARWLSPGPVRRLAIENGRIQLGTPVTGACVGYEVDLREGGNLGAAVRRVGASLLASPNVWLWRPAHRAPEVHASLRVVTPEGMVASLPWPRGPEPHTYLLSAHAFAFDSHAAFGALELVQGEHLEVPFEVALLDAQASPTPAVIATWMAHAVKLASLGPRGFPAERLHVLLVPAESREGEAVAFGSVTRGGVGSVLLFVTPRATLAGLEADWVLPHELSHLYLPFVPRDQAWFSEGAATYYQEVLRARGKVLSVNAALLNMARSMRGSRTEGTGRSLREESKAMHHTHAFRPVYWGGAAFFLMADVELRKRTGGKQSLDTLLAALKREKASQFGAHSVDALLQEMDAHAGMELLEPLAATCLQEGFPAVDPILEALGVVRSDDGSLAVLEAAPLASIREAIFSPQ